LLVKKLELGCAGAGFGDIGGRLTIVQDLSCVMVRAVYDHERVEKQKNAGGDQQAAKSYQYDKGDGARPQQAEALDQQAEDDEDSR
jgi:hypothetical protein